MTTAAGKVKPLFLWSLVFSIVLLGVGQVSASEKGVVKERPTEGRYVEVDGVFLVPYEARIPGTNIYFGMEPIPGGKTLLGDHDDEEAPPVEVEVAPYWIARCEVTWHEYRQYMGLCSIFERFDDQGIRPVTEENRVDAISAPSKLYDTTFTYMSGDAPNLPAVTMSQFAAKQYTKWLSLLTNKFYRLPSEAEWEHACRAGTKTRFSFGDDIDAIDDYAWHEDNAEWETQPVGQKKPNPWGLHDMHGNAREWVLDAYDETGLAVLADIEPTENAPLVNWPTKLFPRVLRGGSVLSLPEDCHTTVRQGSDDNALKESDPNVPKSPWWFAGDDSQDIGFRIVRPYHAPDREQRSRYWDADMARIQKIVNHRIDNEGKGERGFVDPELPAAIKDLKKNN